MRWLRAGMGLAYLLAVNLLAGWLAVELRYPSLWGGSDVFAEYALPLPYGWAMAHWVSMLPLAFVVAALPGWPEQRLLRLRWTLLALLALVALVEVDWTYFKLERIPFMLFFAVDLSLALLLSLVFRPPLRVLGGAALVALLGIVGVRLWLVPDDDSRGHASAPERAGPAPGDGPAEPRRADSQGLFSDTEVQLLRHEQEVRYTLILADTVEPGRAPEPQTICRAAESRYAALAAARHRPAGYRDRVRFMAHPWFEPERKYVYPAGEAGLDASGNWYCAFEYPAPRGR